MGKYVKNLILIMFMLLGAILPCGIVFKGESANANSGIYVEENAGLEINGGIMQNNTEKAITITSGTHTIENLTITGSSNGAIAILSGNVTLKNCVFTNNSSPNI